MTSQLNTLPTAPQPSVEQQQHKRLRDLIAVNFGNTLEWYDWTIYTIFAPFFAAQFFNSANEASALLATLAVFAVGFVTRPLGGLLFGMYADRRGRKVSLTLAMSLTAGGSLFIAVAPTYANVGLAASLLLLVARLVQGLAHGGEMGTSVTYLVERAPAGRRALWGSTSWISVIAGTMLATGVGLAVNAGLTSEQTAAWGWRVAFGLGGVLAVYALYLRRRLAETDVFEKTAGSESENHQDRADAPARQPIGRRLAHNWRGVLIVMGLSAGGSITFYTWLIFAPTYAQVAKGQDATSALAAGLLAQVVFLVAIPTLGLLADRVGRKPLLYAFGIGFIALAFPLDAMIQGGFWSLFGAMSLALLVMACLFAVNGAVWAEVFPTHTRAAGVAAPLSFATAIFGGTAPYLNTWLSGNGMHHLFTGYLVVIAAVTLLTAWWAPETKDYALDRS
ncbi:MAG TPA: MFS transporter [Nocardioidaceae bacterium]|nr:MFS transporter [Nocardioidaceae bacterium]